jgi:predicted nuclease of predicted toxin-antitoxin system
VGLPPIWLDAQLPPVLARWLRDLGAADVWHVADLDLLMASDLEVHSRARAHGAIVITKDIDFVQLLEQYGPPPQIVWVTCGNVSNVAMRTIFETAWPRLGGLLAQGEPLVEVGSRRA